MASSSSRSSGRAPTPRASIRAGGVTGTATRWRPCSRRGRRAPAPAIDLVRGAFDAHLRGGEPGMASGLAVAAALVAGGAWTVVGVASVGGPDAAGLARLPGVDPAGRPRRRRRAPDRQPRSRPARLAVERRSRGGRGAGHRRRPRCLGRCPRPRPVRRPVRCDHGDRPIDGGDRRPWRLASSCCEPAPGRSAKPWSRPVRCC